MPCPSIYPTQPTQGGDAQQRVLNAQAGDFAKAALVMAGSDPMAQVTFVLRRILQRAPTQSEIDRGLKFLATTQQNEKVSAEEALRQFCLLALNLNEFVYLE
jgi:hypothetical protein